MILHWGEWRGDLSIGVAENRRAHRYRSVTSVIPVDVNVSRKAATDTHTHTPNASFLPATVWPSMPETLAPGFVAIFSTQVNVQSELEFSFHFLGPGDWPLSFSPGFRFFF